jgi:hypothetical protein
MLSFGELQIILKKNYDFVHNEPNHRLFLLQRTQLYTAFGLSNHPQSYEEEKEKEKLLKKDILSLTLADRICAWLDILSVKKVLDSFGAGILSRKERSITANIDVDVLNIIPSTILTTAERLLLGEINASSAWKLLNNDFHYAADTIHNVYNYSSAFIFNAACDALAMALGIPQYDGVPIKIFTEQFINPRTEIVAGESSSEVMAAFAAEDRTPIHLWNEWEVRKYSATKKLEFWDWWLSEAIPQAWELAQQSAK